MDLLGNTTRASASGLFMSALNLGLLVDQPKILPFFHLTYSIKLSLANTSTKDHTQRVL